MPSGIARATRLTKLSVYDDVGGGEVRPLLMALSPPTERQDPPGPQPRFKRIERVFSRAVVQTFRRTHQKPRVGVQVFNAFRINKRPKIEFLYGQSSFVQTSN